MSNSIAYFLYTIISSYLKKKDCVVFVGDFCFSVAPLADAPQFWASCRPTFGAGNGHGEAQQNEQQKSLQQIAYAPKPTQIRGGPRKWDMRWNLLILTSCPGSKLPLPPPPLERFLHNLRKGGLGGKKCFFCTNENEIRGMDGA